MVLEARSLGRHEPLQRAGIDGKVHAALLVLIQLALCQLLVALLLEGDDDQGYEDVDKKEREDYEVDDVEEGHLHAVAGQWAVVDLGGLHRVLEDGGPALACLHGEEGKQGEDDVVVVELPAEPASLLDVRVVGVPVIAVELAPC